MALEDRLTAEQRKLIKPFEIHRDLVGLTSRQITQRVLDGTLEPRIAADFLLARQIRKVA